MQRTPPAAPRRGLTLIEAIVALSVIAILAGAMIPRLAGRRAAERDARRVADVERVRAAIERYRADRGAYPAAAESAAHGGWDVSHDGDFVPELVARGYLPETAHDPLDDESHHYRYYLYAPGAFGREAPGAYFVLGVRAFETAEFAVRRPGAFRARDRDWSNEFAYVVGPR